ncbi:MAG: hypothetical protein ACK58T_34410 [Phycisphaerae bacterium]|jgi:hypothetical protein
MRPRRRPKKKSPPVRKRRHPKHDESAVPPEVTQPQAAVGVPLSTDPRQTKLYREMLWHNVIREMLTALSLETAQADAQGKIRVLDGRIAIVNFRGERIPIAAIRPLISFGVGNTAEERRLSMMLQGTVFQIVTPAGDVYTLPLHEIRGLHALSEGIMNALEQATGEPDKPSQPFGFAAFTSLARGVNDTPISPAPNDPGE